MWESGLESVVVHAVGAVCRRRAAGVLPADGRVRVAGLPRLAAEGSLRVRVLSGDGKVAEARLEYPARVRTPDEHPSWERELTELAEEVDRLAERRDRLDARIAEVAGLRAVPPQRRREDGHRRAPADAVLALADFVDARLEVLQERAVELAQELRLAEHAHLVALARVRAGSDADRPGGVEAGACADVTVRGAGPVELEVEYAVPGAVWVPTYRLAHRRGERSARLVLRASVAQRTGEDWSGVRLALSTARLAGPGGLPELASLRIGRRQAAPAPSGWRGQPEGLAGLFDGWQDAQASKPEPTEPPRPVPVAAGGAMGGGGPRPAGRRARSAGAPGAPAAPGFAPQPQGPSGPPPPMPPPMPMTLSAPAPAAAGAPPPGYGSDVLRSAAAPRAAFAAQADAAPPPEPAVPAEPRPSADQLDYAAMVLAGPEEESFRRGRLFPSPAPSRSGALRGADAVARLPLPRFGAPPRESAGSFDHRFDAQAPAHVPSDGVWHTVAVAELPVGVRTGYVCVPSVEEAVYAVLELSNATPHALLAGPVEVSVDGDFLLTAGLPTLAPGGVRELGLGRAEELRVARHSEVRESTSGVLNSTAVLDHAVRIELVNRLPHEASVEVRERVPVSADGEVRIEERPGWSPPDEPSAGVPASARLRRVVVPAGGSVELTGGYVIRIPAGKAVVGGNRRS
ncbi:hypothetical protein KSE_57550 [Kitasatospora setae KM-6054]|uniref:DUF4139 domain-containing protein n=1 Tax=Kitasatospora setae (strain ATCC 33774 / DSM 43861 / JCM 3304 / KCC A-0304 / NBRC 14216 / KM-6054) TaxID=452652 RepID=E4N3P7_KITSK|nr:hypothetical protein KSE_57550 [Kitasatospora setae KM-6054]